MTRSHETQQQSREALQQIAAPQKEPAAPSEEASPEVQRSSEAGTTEAVHFFSARLFTEKIEGVSWGRHYRVFFHKGVGVFGVEVPANPTATLRRKTGKTPNEEEENR